MGVVAKTQPGATAVTARVDPTALARLYDQSAAERWALSREAFDAAIAASVAHAFADKQATAADIDRYIAALHVDDLALAAACAAGSEPAWEHFIAEHRPLLYRAADAIDATGNARELADSLYADLYGMDEHAGVRRSLFRYFHGRSRISTWLRAVLSQRHIDRLRAGRKLDPLPEDADELAAGSAGVSDPERQRQQAAVQTALAAAIAALPPRDRLRIACYYAQDMTLAAIGRMLKEHEATVSRHLSRTRLAIRTAVEARLRTDHGMDEAAIAECFDTVVGDAGSMDLADLMGPVPHRKIVLADRSRE